MSKTKILISIALISAITLGGVFMWKYKETGDLQGLIKLDSSKNKNQSTQDKESKTPLKLAISLNSSSPSQSDERVTSKTDKVLVFNVCTNNAEANIGKFTVYLGLSITLQEPFTVSLSEGTQTISTETTAFDSSNYIIKTPNYHIAPNSCKTLNLIVDTQSIADSVKLALARSKGNRSQYFSLWPQIFTIFDNSKDSTFINAEPSSVMGNNLGYWL